MKRKITKTFATLLLSATCLTGCMGTTHKVSFSEYWKKDSTAAKTDFTETLEYDVKYESNNISTYYTLDYTNGKYKTELIASTEADGRKIYTYKTELTITAVYTFNGEIVEFNDKTLTEVKFEQSSTLRPISSRKELISHSPAENVSSATPTEISHCYKQYDYTVETVYTGNGAGNCKVTKNGETPTTQEDIFELDVEKYSYLDNEQLLFAIRGLKAVANNSSTFMVYSPFAKNGQKIKTTFAAKEGTQFSYLRNGTAVKETIEYFPASLEIESQNPGATQTAWFAATTDPQNNTYRNVMLRLETPISYNLGTLVYQLSSANFAE